MFSCKDMSKHASAYVDHHMSVLDRVKFRLHLFICHNCRNYIAQFRTTVASLARLRREPDTHIVDGVVQKLLRDRASPK